MSDNLELTSDPISDAYIKYAIAVRTATALQLRYDKMALETVLANSNPMSTDYASAKVKLSLLGEMQSSMEAKDDEKVAEAKLQIELAKYKK